MIDVFELVRVVLRVFFAAPLLVGGALWWAFWARAKQARMPWAWLGPIAVATWLYKNRRDLRKVIVFGSAAVLTVVWAGLLWASPSLRFAVGLALPSGLATAGLMWLASEYPQLPPFLALQCAIAERRQREVLSDAVPASAGEGARVVAVRPLGGDEFEAEIIGPAGVPHADLVASLQASLAESVLSLSGRRLAHVSVVGTGSKGSVLVRCSTRSPYGRTVRLEDL